MTHTDQPERRQPPMSLHGDISNDPADSGCDHVSRPAPARRSVARSVAPAIARQIDENLKRLYREQIAQDLPPELAALVARLRESETGNGSGGGGQK